MLGSIAFLVTQNYVLAALGADWTRATASAGWATRYGLTSVDFDNKMWIMGGTTGSSNTSYNDVWYTSDGTSWTQATAAAPWGIRRAHTSLVFDNKMWIMGGTTVGTNATSLNDVWYSSDGVTWTQATASAGWSPRFSHASFVFDNKMWVMGGLPFPYKNDVWYSSDGVTWTQATASAGWSPRAGSGSVVFNNRMWVIGGSDVFLFSGGGIYNDIWSSSDGVSWTRATASAGWSPMAYFSSVVVDGKMWVLSGSFLSVDNGVWYSSDGVTWTQATASAGWSPGRWSSTSVIFDNKMWLMGGFGFNDVWYSGAPPSCGVDIGLRYYDGEVIKVGAEPAGTLTSPLRIRKGGTTFGLTLVDTTNSSALPMRIRTASGVKALCRLP